MAFEEDLARLEELVRCLEEGRLTLEESLRAFDEGMALATRLGNQLKEAEQKILVVTAEAGHAPQLRPAPALKPEVTEG
ncbi:MAG TPA: exodeoxyribonuclease VII small subunit [Spirochaetia bacterium]|nr:exodeoxyribonuclease VII small subunit [Spirochaetia bacterium]